MTAPAAIIVVRCHCQRPWVAPVRLDASLVGALYDVAGPAAPLATVKCRRCGAVTTHSLGEVYATVERK